MWSSSQLLYVPIIVLNIDGGGSVRELEFEQTRIKFMSPISYTLCRTRYRSGHDGTCSAVIGEVVANLRSPLPLKKTQLP